MGLFNQVCLFSYGQTGSGKTHTMLGDITGDERGIIPRSVSVLWVYTSRVIVEEDDDRHPHLENAP
jgi:hypothetical protein